MWSALCRAELAALQVQNVAIIFSLGPLPTAKQDQEPQNGGVHETEVTVLGFLAHKVFGNALFLGSLKTAALQVVLPTQKQPMFQHASPTRQSACECSTFSLVTCKIGCQPVASRQAMIM